MTLVERHFDFGGFLCREDEEEIAIENVFGAGGRRGGERKEKGETRRRKGKFVEGRDPGESVRGWTDRDREDRQDKTGQDREP